MYLSQPLFYWGSPVGSMGKESTCNAGDARDPGLIPGSGRSTGTLSLTLDSQ